MFIVLHLDEEEAKVLAEQLEDLVCAVDRTDYYVSRLGWPNEGVANLLNSVVGTIKTVLHYHGAICRKTPKMLEALTRLTEEVGRVLEDFREFGGMEDPDLRKAYNRAFDVIKEATTLAEGELE